MKSLIFNFTDSVYGFFDYKNFPVQPVDLMQSKRKLIEVCFFAEGVTITFYFQLEKLEKFQIRLSHMGLAKPFTGLRKQKEFLHALFKTKNRS